MNDALRSRPSPTAIVVVIALSFLLAGSAIAGTDAVTNRITKAKVKKIAKKQARKVLAQQAPGLSVANAVNAQNAANAGTLGGTPPEGFFRYGSTIPSGVTVTGAFGSQDADNGPSGDAAQREHVSFPLPAPADLTDQDVNFAPHSVAQDDDPSCDGSFNNPTAPAGKVCLYASAVLSGTVVGSARGDTVFNTNGQQGFEVQSNGGTVAGVFGTWAYHAP